MNFILTTEEENSLKNILNPYYYKFLDVDSVKVEYESQNDVGDPKFQDIHFNFYLTKKIQNNFKSSKIKYFVYKVPSINFQLVQNLQVFIKDKYEEKVDKFMIISSEIKKCKKNLKGLHKIEYLKYCPDLESFE